MKFIHPLPSTDNRKKKRYAQRDEESLLHTGQSINHRSGASAPESEQRSIHSCWLFALVGSDGGVTSAEGGADTDVVDNDLGLVGVLVDFLAIDGFAFLGSPF